MFSHIQEHRQTWQYFCNAGAGDKYGMNLDHGGHLTHGSPVNMSGKYFNIVPYGVNDEGFIDYDRMKPARQRMQA